MNNEHANIPASKAAFRGKMLVASFGEATPPVVWRWLASDVSTGFGLRQADNKVELVRYDAGANPAVVAVFPSVEAGELALSHISDALLDHKAPWKTAAKWVASFAAVAVLLGGSLYGFKIIQHNNMQQTMAASIRQLEAAQAHSPGRPQTTGQLPAQQAEALRRQQAAQAAKPAQVPTGTAVDVDSVYH